MKSKKNSVKELTLIASMAAILEAAKAVLSMIPNVELVSLLLIVYTLCLGLRRTMAASFLFTGIECLIYGLGIWTVSYLYVWPILILLAHAFRKHDEAWVFVVLSAGFGLSFGALCAVAEAAFGGFRMALSWWIAGIPYDIIHCIGNFTVCILLFKPLRKGLTKIESVMNIAQE